MICRDFISRRLAQLEPTEHKGVSYVVAGHPYHVSQVVMANDTYTRVESEDGTWRLHLIGFVLPDIATCIAHERREFIEERA